MENNLIKWHLRFIQMAQLVSTYSKDPSTKCGAVIVRPNRTIASVGYNGFPRGCNDSPSIYEDRELKYARVIHAEMNAILNCVERPEGYSIYTYPSGTGPSCERCSAHIIQAGIKEVYHLYNDKSEMNDRWHLSSQRGLDMYNESKIIVYSIQLNDHKLEDAIVFFENNPGKTKVNFINDHRAVININFDTPL